ncbi:solute carrier family 22 member 4-like isoform X1 [Centruroides sculpturatus]|uniref:solute carrier family 22 member 4-like isoform X1 n=1 Tax=Centruroides sculpturatus TaxID=218467 RepID=UPI000C6E471B|nr:solute carrier family 22 member 4-like isoform X1 [Centruroides sculpturatus]
MNNISNEINSERVKEEDIIDIIGHWGKWQLFLMILMIYMNIPNECSMFAITFMAPKINYWCTTPLNSSNTTTEKWKNFTIPLEEIVDKEKPNQCDVYSITEKGEKIRVPCHSWDYDHSFYKSTITEKWNLVCKNAYLPSLVQSLFFFGYLLSTFIGGQLSDKFGRKPVLYLSSAWTFLFGMICTFSENFWLFAISRFLLGLGQASTCLIVYVLLTEVVGKDYRVIVGFFNKVGWGLGQMIIPGLVWLFRDWFYINLIYTLTYLIFLLLWWITPESPRWLLSQDRVNEAENVTINALKINKREIDHLNERLKIISELNEKENKRNQNNQATFSDIMKSPNLRRMSFILYVAWISTVISYYGLSFSADDIGLDVLLFFFLSALLEIPASFSYYYFQRFVGRRYTQIACLIVSGSACLVAIAVPKDFHKVLISLAVVSKFSLSVSFSSLYLLSSEIYPTVVRNVGLGSCSTVGRIGAIAAPFMKEAASQIDRSFPLALFGTMSLIGGLLVFFLPETKNMELADTIEQGETIGRHEVYVLTRNFEKEDNAKEN